MDRVHYRPNNVARSLKAHRTLTLGLLADDLHGETTTAMMQGIEEVASAEGFGVLLCNSYGDRARERAHLETLIDKRVDGVIVMSGRRTEERSGPAASLGSLPTVFLFRYTLDLPVPCIVPDDHLGGRIATEHLLGLGRRRIAILSGPSVFETSSLRIQGYQDALEAAGIPVDPSLIATGDSWYEDAGYELASRLGRITDPPDAYVCGRDAIASGVLDALREQGRKVPGEVSVVGYHDLPSAAHLRPPLTTVARPLTEMGRRAARILIDAIGGHPHPAEILRMPCELIVRDSSAPREGSQREN
jgi:LacI family transcriptional regulator